MRMIVLLPAIALGASLGSLSAVALVGNPIIHQLGRTFSSQSATVKKGTPITFMNDDNVPHNIASTSTGNEFNLGSQPPGTSTEVTFTVAGEVAVICAIHPRMKMTVIVTN